MQKMIEHLLDRHLNPSNYPTSVVVTEQETTFKLWNLSGQMLGYQVYNPSYDKKRRSNPRECRYFTHCYEPAIWGLEVPLIKPYVFVQEGVFDASRLHSFGHPAIATLSNKPVHLSNWLSCIPQKTVCLGDGGAAGLAMREMVDIYIQMPKGEDVASVSKVFLIQAIDQALNTN